jgi:hypothetical protein
LRKAVLKRRAGEHEASERVISRLDVFTDLVTKPAPDISAVFMPEPAPRPETPRYIANAAADHEAEEKHQREKSPPLSLEDGGAKWRSRVERHAGRQKARADQMRAYYAKDLKAQRDYLSALKAAEEGKAPEWKPHPTERSKH